MHTASGSQQGTRIRYLCKSVTARDEAAMRFVLVTMLRAAEDCAAATALWISDGLRSVGLLSPELWMTSS